MRKKLLGHLFVVQTLYRHIQIALTSVDSATVVRQINRNRLPFFLEKKNRQNLHVCHS